MVIYVFLLLVAAALPFTQILMGHHTLPKYKTNASSFLIANGVVHFNLLIRILCKLSKTCINCYKCSLAILIIPEIAALGIGIGLLIDFNSWRHAYTEEDYKYCDPWIFYPAYGLNIGNFIIFTGYLVNAIINHFERGLSTTPNAASQEIYCCGEIV